MITFDSGRLRVPTLDDMFGSPVPDDVECGETMNCFVYAVRSRGVVELRSKESGAVITSFRPGDGDILPPRIRDACVQALKLADRSDATTEETR